MQKSSTSFEVDDSAKQNQVTALLHQLNHNTEQAEDVEEMFKELDTLSVKTDKKEQETFLELESNKEEKLSHEDEIKRFTESIKDSKSPIEILKILIQKFENEPAVKTWLKNWRNFLKLHELAQSKPAKEKATIQQIIFSADFSKSSAFQDSLAQIASNQNISAATKQEIALQFNPADITSVDGFDSALQQLQSRKKSAKNLLFSKQEQQVTLDNEIESLESELEKSPLNSLKRERLEAEIEQKKKQLQTTQSEIENLEIEANKNPAFQLRNGFIAQLNQKGSRSIKISTENFTIRLPSHSLPFTTRKNLGSLNLTFVVAPLLTNHIANAVFNPNLGDNNIPTKSQRNMGHLILNSLGFDDTRILNNNDIQQVHADLNRLVFSPVGKSGEERLAELGIYDVVSQKLDEDRLKNTLYFIRENREMKNELFYERLKQEYQ